MAVRSVLSRRISQSRIFKAMSRRAQLSAVALALFALLLTVVPAFGDAIHDAAKSGNVAKVRELLHKDASLANSTSDVDSRGIPTNRTPLHYAADGGYKEIVSLLLANHADVNAKDVGGTTPLHLAAAEGHLEVVRMLLAAKADPNATDRVQITPLLLASAAGYHQTVALLLAHHANVNAQDHAGMTPLLLASGNGYTSIVRMLLAHKAKVNLRDRTGASALHLAIMQGHKEVAAILRQHGAQDSKASSDE
jgi:ankyrin repeat protein